MVFKAKWRFMRSQRARDASRPTPSANTSLPEPPISPTRSTSIAPQITSAACGGSEPAISATNTPVTDPPTRSVPIIHTHDAVSAPVCVADTSTRWAKNHASSVSSTPCNEGNKYKPFIRLASDRRDAELKILVYSYVMSDSPFLRLAVQATGDLAELMQASISVPIH
jgi:hypothetical protein